MAYREDQDDGGIFGDDDYNVIKSFIAALADKDPGKTNKYGDRD